jgi:hypothetical protein
VAELTFSDEHFPGDVTLTAFNPYIPLDSNNSSIPAAFFEVEFHNPTDHPLRYEAALSVPNPFRSVNRAFDKGVMLCDADKEDNNLTIMTDAEEAFVTDYWYRGWRNNFYRDNIRTYWQDFAAGKDLTCRGYTEAGDKDHATVSGRVSLAAGERKTVRLVLTWNIPDFVKSFGVFGQVRKRHRRLYCGKVYFVDFVIYRVFVRFVNGKIAVRTLSYIRKRLLVYLKNTVFCARFDCHIRYGKTVVHGKRAYAVARKFHRLIERAVNADFADYMKYYVLSRHIFV